MMTLKLKWFEIAWPHKGYGHRFFRNAGGTLFIADLSGCNPDLTNDGPLAVLPGRMKVVVEDGRALVFVNVLSERTKSISSTVMDVVTARWLRHESGMDFQVTCNIPGLTDLLS